MLLQCTIAIFTKQKYIINYHACLHVEEFHTLKPAISSKLTTSMALINPFGSFSISKLTFMASETKITYKTVSTEYFLHSFSSLSTPPAKKELARSARCAW